MGHSRRIFLKGMGAAAAVTATPLAASAMDPVDRGGQAHMKLSLAAYSYRKYLTDYRRAGRTPAPGSMTIEDFVDLCARLELDGTEPTSPLPAARRSRPLASTPRATRSRIGGPSSCPTGAISSTPCCVPALRRSRTRSSWARWIRTRGIRCWRRARTPPMPLPGTCCSCVTPRSWRNRSTPRAGSSAEARSLSPIRSRPRHPSRSPPSPSRRPGCSRISPAPPGGRRKRCGSTGRAGRAKREWRPGRSGRCACRTTAGASPSGSRIARRAATSGSTTWRAGPRPASPSIPPTNSIRSGRPRTRASCSARTARGAGDLYQKVTGEGGAEDLLFASELRKAVVDWSRDGRFLLFHQFTATTHQDIWALSLPERKATPVLRTEFFENAGALSPDGRWLAYHSDESGRHEVYVQPFPGPGPKWRISREGGTSAKWRGDGKEIFFSTDAGKLMAVDVTAGATFAAGDPRLLFAARLRRSLTREYDVTPDGQRFLVAVAPSAEVVPPITLVQNWDAALKR